MNLKTSDKRREIINAALKLMAEQGFHGAPMAMIDANQSSSDLLRMKQELVGGQMKKNNIRGQR
ncbi:MAG: hypothetical protein K0B01_07985 [Syntrophobacterales bacterium]|nr:hypothetical protein [Syntrophobacterales bacterium]